MDDDRPPHGTNENTQRAIDLVDLWMRGEQVATNRAVDMVSEALGDKSGAAGRKLIEGLCDLSALLAFQVVRDHDVIGDIRYPAIDMLHAWRDSIDRQWVRVIDGLEGGPLT